MQVGTVGLPLDLATTRDFEAIFAQMQAAGQTLFMPMSLYESHPVARGTGLEAAFFPPPFGTADAAVYDAMRAHGIKMIVPGELLYPLGRSLPVPENDPLVALIDAAGRDLVAAVATYDEPVRNGVPGSALQAVYQHVKAVAPDLPLLEVNAPPEPGQDIGSYLGSVAAAAQWADQVGFSIYDTGLDGAGYVTPFSNGAVVDSVTALADYVRWIDAILPGKMTIGVLQGFGIADLFSDELLEGIDPALVEAARAPDVLQMSESARALAGVETLIWFGPSYLDSSLDSVWRDILAVSASIETETRTGIGVLEDRNSATNVVSEAAVAGTAVGIVLALDREAGETPSFGVDDARFAVLDDGNVILAEAGSVDFERETKVTLTGWARLSDGRIATQSFTLEIADAVEQIQGTSAGEELLGSETDDQIAGLGGADWLWGRGGDDRMDGGADADVLLGEAGEDTLAGDAGADALLGGAGDDRLTGGADADLFVFRENEGRDVVTDFAIGLDKVVLVGQASPSLAISGSSALVLFGGTEILLEGVNPSTLTMQDFHFLDSLG